MNSYLDDRPVNEPWIISKRGWLQETVPQFSGWVQNMRVTSAQFSGWAPNIFIKPRYPYLLDTLNLEEYVSTGSHLIRVTNNPYYQLDQKHKDCFLNNWINKINMISQPVVNIMLNLSKLEDNWDSYGAEKISLRTVINAINFFMQIIDLHPNAPLPFIAPVPDGNIHFEWSMCSSELRHIVPKEGSVCYIYKIIDKRSGELKQYTNRIDGMDEMITIFSQWIEGNY